MPDEKELFQTTGKSWSERAGLGELDAVLTGSGNHVRNRFLHHVQFFAARRALKRLPANGQVIDFGCGTGRFTRFFAEHGHSVVGTEVTKEMLEQAKHFGVPSTCEVVLTNGIDVPVADESVDLIWVCGVLRYSLNVPNPAYEQIAREMYRIMKPNGVVVNVEMYVDQPSSDFTRGFEAVGFHTEKIKIINRHKARVERFIQSRRWPPLMERMAAKTTAFGRYYFDASDSLRPGLRDYFFVWRKPRH